MNLHHGDTIVAVATPNGRGAIAVVRLSGPGVPAIANEVLGALPPPRRATLAPFKAADGAALDRGIALFFSAPNSFTGEHVLELHAHGGPVVTDLLLRRICTLGARPARPGEFSLRAFLNDKIDLAQAEAIADLIESHTAAAARAAARALQGELSRRVHRLVDKLIELRAHLEATLDFPDEDIDLLADATFSHRLDTLQQTLAQTLESAHRGALLKDGIRLVLVGPPNAGKSSLLNRLTGTDTAIVTPVPGTTRDLVREQINLDGIPIHLVDTAGLRESADPVEREGVRRAHAEAAAADHVLLILDDALGSDPSVNAKPAAVQPYAPYLASPQPSAKAVTVVHNKIDLSGHEPAFKPDTTPPRAWVSALTGAGFEQLRRRIRDAAGAGSLQEGTLLARRRHIEALERARTALAEARGHLQRYGAPELAAEDLRGAQQALAEITGAFTSEDLLDRIFAGFCIGK